eukprot:4779026-Prymnesium_polylepis.1
MAPLQGALTRIQPSGTGRSADIENGHSEDAVSGADAVDEGVVLSSCSITDMVRSKRDEGDERGIG